MQARNYRDILGGGLLLALGLFYSGYAASHYDLGSPRHMGPGFFPTGLGLVLAGFGAVLILTASLRQSPKMPIRIMVPILILTGVATFAAIIRPFGLVPAIFAVTAISSLADHKLRTIHLALLCIVLSLLAWLTFRVGLSLSIPMLRWPF